MGATDADKTDMVIEYARQLIDVKTYLKLTEKELKTIKFKTNLNNMLV